MKIHVPASICTKEDLFQFLSEQLMFPGYFGRNWDALDECLSDLSWIEDGEVVIFHDAPPLQTPEERQTYLSILQHAVEEGSGKLKFEGWQRL